jgi:hypothetical protein
MCNKFIHPKSLFVNENYYRIIKLYWARSLTSEVN